MTKCANKPVKKSKNTTNSKNVAHNKSHKAMTHAMKVACKLPLHTDIYIHLPYNKCFHYKGHLLCLT